MGAAAALAPQGVRGNCIRVGMIWGIASAAVFLSTDQARWISGQVLAEDGGGFAMRNVGAAGSK